MTIEEEDFTRVIKLGLD